jgi:hypothetical protein
LTSSRDRRDLHDKYNLVRIYNPVRISPRSRSNSNHPTTSDRELHQRRGSFSRGYLTSARESIFNKSGITRHGDEYGGAGPRNCGRAQAYGKSHVVNLLPPAKSPTVLPRRVRRQATIYDAIYEGRIRAKWVPREGSWGRRGTTPYRSVNTAGRPGPVTPSRRNCLEASRSRLWHLRVQPLAQKSRTPSTRRSAQSGKTTSVTPFTQIRVVHPASRRGG